LYGIHLWREKPEDYFFWSIYCGFEDSIRAHIENRFMVKVIRQQMEAFLKGSPIFPEGPEKKQLYTV